MKGVFRKFALVFLAACMMVTLAGCGTAAQQQPSEDLPQQEQPEAPDEGIISPDEPNEEEAMQMTFTVNGRELTASLADTNAAKTLYQMLGEGDITLRLRDYGGWEKVGELGFSLPTSNQQMTAQPCDFVLYQGDQFVLFYGSNSWSYTRLGRIEDVSAAELKEILGSGNVTVTLSR